jgi:hypothetical protein
MNGGIMPWRKVTDILASTIQSGQRSPLPMTELEAPADPLRRQRAWISDQPETGLA